MMHPSLSGTLGFADAALLSIRLAIRPYQFGEFGLVVLKTLLLVDTAVVACPLLELVGRHLH